MSGLSVFDHPFRRYPGFCPILYQDRYSGFCAVIVPDSATINSLLNVCSSTGTHGTKFVLRFLARFVKDSPCGLKFCGA